MCIRDRFTLIRPAGIPALVPSRQIVLRVEPTAEAPQNPRRSTQSEDVLHVEQSAFARSEETRRAQATDCVGHATGGPVGDFDSLSGSCKKRRVIADDVAAANRRKADGGRAALAGYAFPAIDRTFGEVPAQRLCDYLSLIHI